MYFGTRKKYSIQVNPEPKICETLLITDKEMSPAVNRIRFSENQSEAVRDKTQIKSKLSKSSVRTSK